jgi:hypothetical protein
MRRFFRRLGVERLSYDTERFPWRERVFALFDQPLEAGAGTHHQALQSSSWHQRFYARFGELRELYLDFIRWLCIEYNLHGVIYQAVPTLRVHAPGSKAVGEWHYDRNYGHVDGEAILWLPLTPCWGTNTFWIGEQPQELDYGELIVFDGVNLYHGNHANMTQHTRVSFDFRLAGFQPSGMKTASAGRRLDVGDYFEVLT